MQKFIEQMSKNFHSIVSQSLVLSNKYTFTHKKAWKAISNEFHWEKPKNTHRNRSTNIKVRYITHRVVQCFYFVIYLYLWCNQTNSHSCDTTNFVYSIFVSVFALALPSLQLNVMKMHILCQHNTHTHARTGASINTPTTLPVIFLKKKKTHKRNSFSARTHTHILAGTYDFSCIHSHLSRMKHCFIDSGYLTSLLSSVICSTDTQSNPVFY